MTPSDWKDALGALLPDDYTPDASEDTKKSETKENAKPQLQIFLDKKRAGKTATIITGFATDDPQAEALASALKRRLACGGSSRGGEILIQGDRTEQVIKILTQQGYKVKKG